MALFFYKEKNKDIRAAAYLRLSIEDGDKAESNSIGNQRELIRDFAAERPGLHLVEEYADDGYTGTNFERPGFKRMMEDLAVTYHTSGDLQSFWCYLALAAICLTLDVLVTINLLRTIHGRGKRRRKNS